jgi:probable F420-dependent oxidoreductase
MLVDRTFAPGPLVDAAAAARAAAAAGFDGFFTAETSHDPFLPLAVAATAAPGLTLGTGIAVAFPRSPMVVAQTARDLADATGGRFILGLGTQIKPHIVRRFSTAWSPPVPRLREYIQALRAIWSAFDGDAPLRFDGEHYRFSLLTPFFSPGPSAYGPIPVAIAGVGPALGRLAGELCDGFHIHPFHTVRYLDEVIQKNIAGGASAAGRQPGEVARYVSVFIVTGRDEDEMASVRARVKSQIGFYASTPSYRPVLDLHGWGFGSELTALTKRGRWAEIGEVIPDEVVDEVAIVAEPDRIGAAVRARYAGRVERLSFYNLGDGAGFAPADMSALVSAVRS